MRVKMKNRELLLPDAGVRATRETEVVDGGKRDNSVSLAVHQFMHFLTPTARLIPEETHVGKMGFYIIARFSRGDINVIKGAELEGAKIQVVENFQSYQGSKLRDIPGGTSRLRRSFLRTNAPRQCHLSCR